MRRKSKPYPKRMVADLLRRSDGQCEVHVAPQCQFFGGEVHHLTPRSKGRRDVIANVVMACGECHRWIHAHPREAKVKGWLR